MNLQTQEAIYESLVALSQANQYYKWLFSRVKPFIRGKVLEIGAGIGNFAKWAAKSAEEYHPTDADAFMVEKMKSDFPIAFQWNLFDPFPRNDLYDTVIVLNVVEHIEDDLAALQVIRERMLPAANLIIMVPAMNFLFGSLDHAFGHYRRYTKNSMKQLISGASFSIRKVEYVNVVGMLGWFLYGRILKRSTLPEALCGAFNLMLPLLKIERPVAYFAGLSLIVVAQQ